jgi:N-acetyl-anhydromuramyl-L-alanine amidase AmpD
MTQQTKDPKTNAQRRRQKERRRRLMIATIAVLVLLIWVIIWCHASTKGAAFSELSDHTISQITSLIQGDSNPYSTMEEDWVDVELLPVNDYSRPGRSLTKVNNIVVHYVGNPGTTAMQNRNYFAELADTHLTHASSHFVVGMDGAVVQCIPLNEVSLCSNDRNDDTIAIECCHPDDTGEFTQETYDSLVRLLASLCSMYHLEPDDIIRHYDVTGKECPLFYVKNEDAWEQLKEDVANYTETE